MTRVTSQPPSDGDIETAAALIRRGELVVFPTETVYGLGADARNDEACRRIFARKGRPADNPLIVHVAELEEITEVAAELPDIARRLFQGFSPGPLSVILPAAASVAAAATAGNPTVAVRIPAHPVARRFLRACGVPVAAPSANRSGRPSPTTAAMAHRDLAGRVDLILDGGPCAHGLESTVLAIHRAAGTSTSAAAQDSLSGGEAVGDGVTILREGAITREMIRDLLGPDVPIRGGLRDPVDLGSSGAAGAPVEALPSERRPSPGDADRPDGGWTPGSHGHASGTTRGPLDSSGPARKSEADSTAAEVSPTASPDRGEAPDGPSASPGTRHAHYQPNARVEVVTMSQQHADRDVRRLSDRLQVLPQSLRATIVVYSREARKELAAGAQEAAEGRHVVALRDLEEYGRRLFALLVEADERGDELVIAELPPPEGIGRAVRDRLLRAADRGETPDGGGSTEHRGEPPDGGRGTSPGGR